MRVSTAERRAIINTRIASTFPSLDWIRLPFPMTCLPVRPVHVHHGDTFALEIPRNTEGCQPVREPGQLREQTNRTLRPRVRALTKRSAHSNPSPCRISSGLKP